MLKYLLAALALITAPAAYGDPIWHVFDYECDPDSNYLYFGYVTVYYPTLEAAQGTELPSNRVFREEDWTGHRRLLSKSEGITFEQGFDSGWMARSINEDEHPVVASCTLSYPTEIDGIRTDKPLEFQVSRTGRMILEGQRLCGAWMSGGFEIVLNGHPVEAWPGERDVCRAFQLWDRFRSIEFSGSDGFSRCASAQGGLIAAPSDIELTCDTTTPDFPAVPPAE